MPLVRGTYTPTERKKEKVPQRGYNINRSPRVQTTLTEHQVLEARWMKEFGGWTTAQVRKHYQLSTNYVGSLLGYRTRSKLFPKADDFPKGYQPKIDTPEN